MYYDIDEERNVATILMYGETPWVYPYLWLKYLKDTYGLDVYLYAYEEFGWYHFFEKIDGESFDCPPDDEQDDFAQSPQCYKDEYNKVFVKYMNEEKKLFYQYFVEYVYYAPCGNADKTFDKKDFINRLYAHEFDKKKDGFVRPN